MIGEIIEGLLSGYLFDRLLRRIPPKTMSSADSRSFDELRRRNNWIEVVANITSIASFVLVFSVFMATGLNHNAWRIGVMFFFPFTLATLVVCVLTLPFGLTRFREFWRFHELKHRIRLAVLLSLYLPFTAIGAVSLLKAFP
jgi:hypothetical protein